MIHRKTLVLGVCSGVLLIISYRLPGFWPLLFVSLVPLLIASYGEGNHRSIFLSGAIAGTMIMGVGTEWLFATLPLPPVFGVTSSSAGPIIVFSNWFLEVLATGPVMGFFALLLRELDVRRALHLFVAAALFVGAEALRMITYNLLTFAPGVMNPPFFSAGFVGYALADNEGLRQLGHWGGVYTLSFVVVFVNLLLFRFLVLETSKRRKILGTALTAATILGVACYPVVSLRERLAPKSVSSVSVAVLSLDAPSRFPGVDFSPFNEQALTVTKAALLAGAEVVLLPEDSRLLFPFSTTTYATLTKRTDAVIVDSGAVRNERGQQVIRAFASRANSTTSLRDKVVLTPDGEYLVWFYKLMLTVVGEGKAAAAFESLRNYTNGEDAHALTLPSARGSVFFCLEVLMPGIVSNLARADGSTFVLIPSSHAWFHHSSVLEQDVLRYNRVQAVEAGLPEAVSINGAPGYALDRYGRVIAKTGDDGKPSFVLVQLPL
jgi:apolipoprotein N-acyltransferase